MAAMILAVFTALTMTACAGGDAVDGVQSALGFALIVGPMLRLLTLRSDDETGSS